MENQDSVLLLKLAALFSSDPPFILNAVPYKATIADASQSTKSN